MENGKLILKFFSISLLGFSLLSLMPNGISMAAETMTSTTSATSHLKKTKVSKQGKQSRSEKQVIASSKKKDKDCDDPLKDKTEKIEKTQSEGIDKSSSPISLAPNLAPSSTGCKLK